MADVATPGLTVTDSGLTANTVYSYALFAHDAASHYSVPSTTTTTTGGGTNPSWILADWAAEKLQNYGLSSAQLTYFFNNPGTEVNVHGNLPQVLAELPNATRFQDFTSFATMAAAFQTGAILPGVTAIMYDNERWSKTPVIEQQNPVAYATQAENLVHSHGMRFILTFAADVAPGSGTKYQRYLNDNFAGQGAHISDVFDIQAQQAEGTTEFQPFAAQAIAQARAGNPACVVLVGIGSAPNGVTVTPSQILNDYQSVRTVTDGYWLNDAGQTSVDVSFLQLLAASQGQ